METALKSGELQTKFTNDEGCHRSIDETIIIGNTCCHS